MKIRAKIADVVLFRIDYQLSKKGLVINKWDHRAMKTSIRMAQEDQRTILPSLDMDMVSNIGPMELITKVNGLTTKLKVKEHFGMPKEMSIEVNSKTIWPMVMVSILT